MLYMKHMSFCILMTTKQIWLLQLTDRHGVKREQSQPCCSYCQLVDQLLQTDAMSQCEHLYDTHLNPQGPQVDPIRRQQHLDDNAVESEQHNHALYNHQTSADDGTDGEAE